MYFHCDVGDVIFMKFFILVIIRYRDLLTQSSSISRLIVLPHLLLEHYSRKDYLENKCVRKCQHKEHSYEISYIVYEFDTCCSGFESKEKQTVQYSLGRLVATRVVSDCLFFQLAPHIFTCPCLCVDSKVLDLSRLTSCADRPRRFAMIISSNVV